VEARSLRLLVKVQQEALAKTLTKALTTIQREATVEAMEGKLPLPQLLLLLQRPPNPLREGPREVMAEEAEPRKSSTTAVTQSISSQWTRRKRAKASLRYGMANKMLQLFRPVRVIANHIRNS
jgi:hypothetical protein